MAESWYHSGYLDYGGLESRKRTELPEEEIELPDAPDESIIGDEPLDTEELREKFDKFDLRDKKRRLVGDYYDYMKEKFDLESSNRNFNNFEISSDGRTLYFVYSDKFGTQKINLISQKGEPFNLSSLAKKIGKGATSVIRRDLGFRNFGKEKDIPAKAVDALQDINSKAYEADKSIELDVFKTPSGGPVIFDDTDTKTVETSLTDFLEKETQTEDLEYPYRELVGLDKALQTQRGALSNVIAKTINRREELAKEKQKLAQLEAGGVGNYDEDLKKTIENRIKELEDEISSLGEAAGVHRSILRGQISKIRETISKILHEDKTLGDKLRTLFREQGITIFSILTAIGMTITALVVGLRDRFTAPVSPTPGPPSPSPNGGIKEWVKRQLINLGNLLAKLAGKAAAALPGIIGSIVSWLLSATGKVVNWFANNLWALLVLVVGLLFSTANELIKKY